MRPWRDLLIVALGVLTVAGCAHHPNRKGVLSEQLPVTVEDLAEIREGKRNHEKVLWEYRLYQDDRLDAYCDEILHSLTEVSDRPNLPYQIYLLDSDEVNVFGGPGGHIYITRGFFKFIQSESELAAAIAHEVTHVASYQYAAIPQSSRLQQVYNVALQGSEFAKSAVGSYATAANLGLRGVGKAAPAIARRFGKDEEIASDEKGVELMIRAGYDPRGYLKLVDKLTRVEMNQLEDFAIYMTVHPPFVDRRVILEKKIKSLKLEAGKITIKQDRSINEVVFLPPTRSSDASSVPESAQPAVQKPQSIVFKPKVGGAGAL